MKVAITGHTSGIGKGLFDYFASNNYEVFGFSRSNGFDLTLKEQFESCTKNIVSSEADLTILNAYAGSAQLNMLIALSSVWSMNKNKTIVIIGSNGADFHPNATPRYAIEKSALDRAVFEYTHNRLWNLINIRPGYTDTQMVRHVTSKKMSVKSVIDTVIWAINSPDDCVIQSVTLIPR